MAFLRSTHDSWHAHCAAGSHAAKGQRRYPRRFLRSAMAIFLPLAVSTYRHLRR